MTISLTKVFNPNPGWYRGDFHAHTTCSDGALTPRELSDLAVEQGLDFLTITDHNDIRAFDDFDESFERMILPGVEVTLYEGHFNVFGFDGNTWVTRELFRSVVDLPLEKRYSLRKNHAELTGLLDRLAQVGFFISINHPLLEPWEWRDSQTPITFFDGIELINDPTYRDNYKMNPAARRMWSAWLNAGLRVTGIGGSDFHSSTPSDDRKRISRLNLPLTYVYAEQLSCQAVLEALRRGHAYLSMGPLIEFTANVNGKEYMMGDDLGIIQTSAWLRGRVEGCEVPARAILIKNGAAVAEAMVYNGQAQVEFEVLPDNPGHAWFRLDVIDAQDQGMAISNPIFVGPPARPLAETFGSFLGSFPQA